MRRFFQSGLTLGLAALILAGCGFQLRGQAIFDFQEIERQGLRGAQMARVMDLALKINGLKVNEGEAPVILTLIAEDRSRSIATFSATGRASEVRISYSLTFRAKDKFGEFLIADTELTQQRELTYDDDEILGKEVEENRLVKEMQEEVAKRIITRLGNLVLRHSD